MTIIVSEETGRISVAVGGRLYQNVNAEELKEHLASIQDKVVEDTKRGLLWRGRAKNEK